MTTAAALGEYQERMDNTHERSEEDYLGIRGELAKYLDCNGKGQDTQDDDSGADNLRENGHENGENNDSCDEDSEEYGEGELLGGPDLNTCSQIEEAAPEAHSCSETTTVNHQETPSFCNHEQDANGATELRASNENADSASALVGTRGVQSREVFVDNDGEGREMEAKEWQVDLVENESTDLREVENEKEPSEEEADDEVDESNELRQEEEKEKRGKEEEDKDGEASRHDEIKDERDEEEATAEEKKEHQQYEERKLDIEQEHELEEEENDEEVEVAGEERDEEVEDAGEEESDEEVKVGGEEESDEEVKVAGEESDEEVQVAGEEERDEEVEDAGGEESDELEEENDEEVEVAGEERDEEVEDAGEEESDEEVKVGGEEESDEEVKVAGEESDEEVQVAGEEESDEEVEVPGEEESDEEVEVAEEEVAGDKEENDEEVELAGEEEESDEEEVAREEENDEVKVAKEEEHEQEEQEDTDADEVSEEERVTQEKDEKEVKEESSEDGSAEETHCEMQADAEYNEIRKLMNGDSKDKVLPGFRRNLYHSDTNSSMNSMHVNGPSSHGSDATDSSGDESDAHREAFSSKCETDEADDGGIPSPHETTPNGSADGCSAERIQDKRIVQGIAIKCKGKLFNGRTATSENIPSVYVSQEFDDADHERPLPTQNRPDVTAVVDKQPVSKVTRPIGEVPPSAGQVTADSSHPGRVKELGKLFDRGDPIFPKSVLSKNSSQSSDDKPMSVRKCRAFFETDQPLASNNRDSGPKERKDEVSGPPTGTVQSLRGMFENPQRNF